MLILELRPERPATQGVVSGYDLRITIYEIRFTKYDLRPETTPCVAGPSGYKLLSDI